MVNFRLGFRSHFLVKLNPEMTPPPTVIALNFQSAIAEAAW
jgi:hypothetical protein